MAATSAATAHRPHGGRTFHLRARLRLRVSPVVRGVDDDDFYYGVSNYATIAMGGRLEQFECVVPENGIIDIDHTFKEIPEGTSYHNQMKWVGEPSTYMNERGVRYNVDEDTLIKSHCTIGVYRRRYEKRHGDMGPMDRLGHQVPCKDPSDPEMLNFSRTDQAGPDLENPGPVDAEDIGFVFTQDADAPPATPLTPILRCHMIAYEVFDLGAVCQATVGLTRSKLGSVGGDDDPVAVPICQTPECSFDGGHNFCDTVVNIEVLPLVGGSAGKEADALDSELKRMGGGLEAYAREEALAAQEKRKASHVGHSFMRSRLENLPKCSEIVKLQQTMMQMAAMVKLQRGELQLADEMGAAFMSGSTYLQTHGFAACFTDMSNIVRERVVEMPFKLFMIHAHTAILLNGLTPERVCKMHADSDMHALFSVYLAIMTCEIMDQRQAEYYSDYCLHGVEVASAEDYDSDRQPGPSDVDCSGEKWFYRNYYKGSGEERKFVCHVRYRLRVTEDQRQVCTGKGLRYGIINDDCESSASAQMGENKTAVCLKGDMIRRRVIDDGSLGGLAEGGKTTTTMQERYEATLGRLLSLASGKEGGSADAENLGEILEAVQDATGGTAESDVYLYMAVANILRQFDITMDLCIGTASAAAVGAAAQLSGHCFSVCFGRHLATGRVVPMIVEGTRWVTQERYRPKEERVLTDKTGNMLNEISSMLMEMTKLGGMNVLLDAGVGLMRVVRGGREAPESFYQTIYVIGDSLKLRRNPGGMVVVGAPVSEILGCEEGGAGGVESLPVKYNLACNAIMASAGHRIEPSAVGRAVVEMARETIFPPWSRRHWASIMDNFNEFRVVENRIGDAETTHGPSGPSPNPSGGAAIGSGGPTPNLCGGAAQQKREERQQHIRFSFTHQVYTQLQPDQVEDFKRTIIECIDGVAEGEGGKRMSQTPVLLNYRDRLFDTDDERGKDEPVKSAMAKNRYGFDADRAMQSLEGLPGLVHIERIFLSMNCVVTVCTIRASDIPTVHAKVVGWAKEIVTAQMKKMAQQTKAPQIIITRDHNGD